MDHLLRHPTRTSLIFSLTLGFLAPFSLTSCEKSAGAVQLPPFRPAKRQTQTVAEDMGRLVPDDAVVFARVSSLAGLEEKVRGVVRAFQPGAEGMVNLGAMYGPLNLRERDLEPGKPVAVALRLGQVGPMGQLGPQPILIVPARSPKDLADICEAPAVVSGSYVGIARRAEPSLAETSSPLGNDLPVGDVAVRIRLDRVLAPLRSRLEFMLDPDRLAQRNPRLQQDPVTKTNLQLMTRWARQALDHAKTLEASMSLNDGKLDLSCVFGVGKGSPLDAGPARRDRNLPYLAGSLPMPDAPLVYLMSGVAGFHAAFRPMYQSMAATMSDAEAQQFLALMGKYLEFYQNMQDDLVAAVDFTPAGIEAVALMQTKDTNRLEQDLAWLAAGYASRAEISGVEFTVFTVKFDLGRMLDARITPMLADYVGPVRAIGNRLFAKEGVKIGMGLYGKNVIVVLGNIQELGSRTVAALREGKRYKLAVVEVAAGRLHANPGFLLSMDLRRIARSIAASRPDEVRQGVSPMGPPIPLWFACAADGPVYEVQAHVDLAGIADMVREGKPRNR